MAGIFYKIYIESDVLWISFGQPAQNDQIVQDAVERLDEMVKAGELAGGPVIKINGPASLPVAMSIAHAIGHLYETVACFDPKMRKYVVAFSHGTAYKAGDLIS